MAIAISPMLEALSAEEPHPALKPKLRLYGQFIGSWRVDADFWALDGSDHWSAVGEVHFHWVLQGAAIQDLFIIPARKLRGSHYAKKPWHRYGSTFRWYDPRIDAWRISFFDPLRSVQMEQIGRAVGDEIHQIGDDPSGLVRRWRFTQITDRAFVWLGEVSWDRGEHWMLELKMDAKRTNWSRSA